MSEVGGALEWACHMSRYQDDVDHDEEREEGQETLQEDEVPAL